jgi:leucyl-tRNA synthetase
MRFNWKEQDIESVILWLERSETVQEALEGFNKEVGASVSHDALRHALKRFGKRKIADYLGLANRSLYITKKHFVSNEIKGLQNQSEKWDKFKEAISAFCGLQLLFTAQMKEVSALLEEAKKALSTLSMEKK